MWIKGNIVSWKIGNLMWKFEYDYIFNYLFVV